MKKLSLTLLSVLMFCTLATTNVFAEDGSKETEVTYEAPSTYQWSVPQTLSISTEDSTLDVEVMNPSLAAGEKIKITVESANNFNVKNGSTSLSYKLAKDSEYKTVIANNDVVVETVAGAQQGLQQQLHVKLNAAGTKAGKYSDTLTFTASVIKSAGLYNNGEFISWETLIDDESIWVEDYEGGFKGLNHCSSELTGELLIDSEVDWIGEWALQESELTSVILQPITDVIGPGAFLDSKNLVSIVIPTSVTGIEGYVFTYCTSLSSITYLGTKAQWGAIRKSLNVFNDSSVTAIHCSDGDITVESE